MSAYAGYGGSGGGSAYARGGAAGGGRGIRVGGQASTGIAVNPNAGGLLGGGGPKHGRFGPGSVTGWLGKKLDLAGHDLYAMPTGLYNLGKDFVDPQIALLEGHQKQYNAETHHFLHGDIIGGIGKGSYEALRHPLRDPFQTILTANALAGGAAGAIARGGAAADAALGVEDAGMGGRVGAAAKALAHKPLMPTRELRVPQLLKDENGDLHVAHQPVHLVESHAPLARAFQALHDRILQRSLNKNLTAEKPSLVTRYANSRIGKANDEEGRIAMNANAAQAKMLGRVKGADKGVKAKDAQLALFLRSANVLPHEAADMWAAQRDAGVNPDLTGALVKSAGRLHNAGTLHLDENGDVAVNADKFPKLGAIDKLTKSNQALRDKFISDNNLMSKAGMQSRRDLVGRVVAEHTPAEVEPHIAKEVQSRLSKAEKWHGRVTASAMGRFNHLEPEHAAALAALDPEVQRAAAAVEHLRGRLDGVGGPEAARPGQDYTDLSISKKKASSSPFARSRGNKIPQPKKFSVGQEATGEGVAKGLIPDSTTGQVARSAEDVLREIATREHRSNVYKYGSDVKRQGDDVLIANPHALKLNKIPLDTRQLLGLEHSTLNTLPSEDEAGIAAAIKAKAEDAIPRLISKKAAKFEDDAGVGTEAPGGYRWVPRKIAGDLLHPPAAARSGIVKGVDSVNSAATAMTVYFKLSHIPQRLFTDATTTALNGGSAEAAKYALSSLTGKTLGTAARLREELGPQAFHELTSSTGTHGYGALPQEGESVASKAARGGASFYARKIDEPFRWVNLVHEAAKAKMDTADGMRSLIEAAKNPSKATPRQLSVLKRANRVSMIYDSLGPTEKATIARGLWFYPWTKAAVRFAGHTIAEHPLAAGVGAALGVQGRKGQAKGLGALPYYEYGLTPFGHNEVSNFSTLSPFGTAANVVESIPHLENIRSNLNPAAASLVDLITGTNGFGKQENRGIAALGDLTAPTPEAQILSGFLARHSDQSKKMFPNSGAWYGTKGALLRAILGQPAPRKVNKTALHKATEKWRTISIPVP